MTSRQLSSGLTYPWGPEMANVLSTYISLISRRNHKSPIDKCNIGAEHPAFAATVCLVAEQMRPLNVLEIGVQTGCLAVPLALWCHDNGANYVGIDSFKDQGSGEQSFENIESVMNCYGVYGINLINEEFSPEKHTAEGGWDLVIVDHDKSLIIDHVTEMFRLGTLSDRAVLLVHDAESIKEHVWFPLKKALEGKADCHDAWNPGVAPVMCPELGFVRRKTRRTQWLNRIGDYYVYFGDKSEADAVLDKWKVIKEQNNGAWLQMIFPMKNSELEWDGDKFIPHTDLARRIETMRSDGSGIHWGGSITKQAATDLLSYASCYLQGEKSPVVVNGLAKHLGVKVVNVHDR